MEFVCQVCKKEYQSTCVFLPCGWTVCDLHVKNDDLAQCLFCGQSHRLADAPAARFPVNKPVEIQLGKRRMRDSLASAQERLDDFRRLQHDPYQYVCQHFEKLIQRVYAREGEIIQSVQAYFDAARTKEKLHDAIVVIGDKTVTNYLHATTQVPEDIPAAPALTN